MASESGLEDILTSPSVRITPSSATRKRTASDALDGSENSTPINNLRRLAAQSVNARNEQIPSSSPFRAPSSIASSIGSRIADRTTNVLQNSLNLSRAVGRRPLANASTRSTATGMPTTPHAIRAMEERRRVKMTPSREKRRASGRGLERGSPFNILRSLAQVIAPPVQAPIVEEDEDDEEEDGDDQASAASTDRTDPPDLDESEDSDGILKPPRISLSMNEMRLEEDDDDTGIFRPPEISRLNDEDITVKSVELGRRAEVDASILLGRRNRISDIFGTVDVGKDLADNLTTRQPGSPSFAAGDQSLFPGLAADDDTADLQALLRNQITSPPRITREVDFADSTFRFDIPQDITGSGVDEDNASNEDAGQDELGEADEAAVVIPTVDYGGDSGPEDFGSPSEADESAQRDEIDVDVGGLTDDQQEADLDVADFLVDDQDDEILALDEENPEVTISRQLEDQITANEADFSRRIPPEIRLQPSSREATVNIDQLESEDELREPSPVAQKTAIRRAIPRPAQTTTRPNTRTRTPKPVITSKLGIKVPSLPTNVVKSLADSFLPHAGKTSKKTKADTVKALSQATDWFFERIAQDLDAYSDHANRDTIEESDVVALMKRQRVLGTGAKNIAGNRSAAPGSSKATLFSLAQRFLPRELVSELRMDPPPDQQRRQKRRRISEGGAELLR